MKPHIFQRLAALVMAAVLALPALAMTPDEKVDNFTLKDQHGNTHELYDLADAEAVAIMVQGNGCPIVRNAMLTFRKLRDEYEAKGVKFLLLNSNIQDNAKSIKREAEEYDIDVPIMVDESQDVGRDFGIYRTAEVFVIDPLTWKLKYRGALDDRLGYETQKFNADHSYVQDALDAVLTGKSVAVAKTEAKGCLVNIIDG